MWPSTWQAESVGLATPDAAFDPNLPDLLCVHGSGGRGAEFLPLLESLVGAANGAGIDLPGHGDTPGPGRERVEDYVAWLAERLEQGRRRPVVLGNSLGGAIALGLALERPELIGGIVLWGTGARLRVLPKILEGLAKDFQPTVAFLAQMAYAEVTDPQRKETGRWAMARTAPAVLLGDYTACDRFDVMERLGEIDLPCLVVCGDGDRLTPLKYSQYLTEHIKGARLAVIPGAGHLIHEEQPSAGAKVLAEFLATL
ncbi:alpha/beta fold hydrolase [Desulfoferula mesophila]|uniref:Alpha/beta hydrolase n=1 Tax=Desulfoferula mesophila TaxID=3058419 RepID=A0AAU9EFC7_9BACT|nr:alpha/beta hydrolase [Desulfoferula mesophilus]